MRLQAIIACILIVLPGCISSPSDEENITFNGRDLKGNPVYEFTLETAYGDLWNLSDEDGKVVVLVFCLLYTSPSPRDRQKSRMPSSA